MCHVRSVGPAAVHHAGRHGGAGHAPAPAARAPRLPARGAAPARQQASAAYTAVAYMANGLHLLHASVILNDKQQYKS